jgi:hypothetical protein
VYKVMPRYISTKIQIPASLLSARILFPFGISFFIPLFVYTLTMEKQSRIFIMMKVLSNASDMTDESDEWTEILDLFPCTLLGFSALGVGLHGYISPCRSRFSSRNSQH